MSTSSRLSLGISVMNIRRKKLVNEVIAKAKTLEAIFFWSKAAFNASLFAFLSYLVTAVYNSAPPPAKLPNEIWRGKAAAAAVRPEVGRRAKPERFSWLL